MADKEMIEEKIDEVLGLEKAALKGVEELESCFMLLLQSGSNMSLCQELRNVWVFIIVLLCKISLINLSILKSL